ncbi:hypothetical protein B5M44_21510 [Shinella sumterensis]|uniref:DUF4062 domain-containing protein n=1 Tax=Shinella sumterensis TaxID=1967501 RepID=UPI00106E0078|nr:DUF4062 domain-containing protein [Shinella sumterensis]MCD1266847.1 DUF4062 domain-containing protein [Shinella sumterensis]TFE95295.1 hypothetical protein B5M44_21510 [Shinella sumterensis]
MAEKKYQVFVSSTFRDLVEERQDTIRNILDLNHIPAGMELFPAADVEQLTYIKKVIDECDYYLLIVGGRYGSLDAEGISFTEREYDYAVETGKFVIAFVHGEPGAISVQNSDVKPKLAASLNAFRDKVMGGRLVRQWTNRQDLQLAVLKSLMHSFTAYPQTGWIRGNAAANQETLEQANAALQENVGLRAELARMKAEPAERFPDIADLDDEVVIRYSYKYRISSGIRYPDTDAKFTWRELFLGLASNLSTPRTEAIILNALTMAAEQKGERTPYRMNSTDRSTIKVQFIALGLISTRVSKTTDGKMAEFLTLTERGQQVYISNKVVRKDKA